jgi:hypothetical protein
MPGDLYPPFDNHNHLIRIIVVMPDAFPLRFDPLKRVIIQLGNKLVRMQIGYQARFFKVDNINIHTTSHF